MASDMIRGNDSGDQIDAIARMPKDIAIIKIENDSIMAMASARPRDLKAIKQDLVSQLENFPVFAQRAIYTKPVGKDDSSGGRQKTVRGLSIRAAEALAEAYGFCKVRVYAEPEGDDHARVTATFIDYQKGRTWEDSGIISKWYKAKGGGMCRTPEDRFWSVTVKGEASRRVREVILRSVPPGMKMELQAIAEEAMAKVLTNDQMQKIIVSFQALGVTLDQLENFIGKTIAAGWNADDRVELVGIYNGIKDGETTVAEAFSVENQQIEVKVIAGNTGGTVTGADLTRPGAASKTDRPHQKQESKSESAESAPSKSQSQQSTPDETSQVDPAQDATEGTGGDLDPLEEARYMIEECNATAEVNDIMHGLRDRLAKNPDALQRVEEMAKQRKAFFERKASKKSNGNGKSGSLLPEAEGVGQ